LRMPARAANHAQCGGSQSLQDRISGTICHDVNSPYFRTNYSRA
jgi:hypothetical protein